METIQNYINHFWLDLDASSSMKGYETTLVDVVDKMIAGMAEKSTELEQETRITINTFATHGQRKNLVWDKDVLRMPSIRGLYKAYGWTAMVEGVCQSVDEMLTIPTMHGDHSFVGYVVTDGDENDSRDKHALKPRVARMPENWTLAALVPNTHGVTYAKTYGFPSENIQIWDATSVKGVQEVIHRIQTSTSDFMDARTRGVRGSKSLFSLNPLTAADIKDHMMPLAVGQFRMFPIYTDTRADDFVQSMMGRKIVLGEVYYQLTKTENVQGYKKIAILHNGNIYVGKNARSMLGLGSADERVAPDNHRDYTIFVQSTAPNRKLIEGTKTLLISQ